MEVTEIERKGKRMENKNLRDSKYNIVVMKNILVRKFYNNSCGVDLFNVQKSVRTSKSSLKNMLEIRNVSFK